MLKDSSNLPEDRNTGRFYSKRLEWVSKKDKKKDEIFPEVDSLIDDHSLLMKSVTVSLYSLIVEQEVCMVINI